MDDGLCVPISIAEPIREQLSVDDFTSEKLGVALANNPKGIAVVRDELAGLFGDLGRYHKGKGTGDSTRLLTGWSRGSLQVDRIDAKRNFIVSKACLSILGGIQPGILAKAFKGEKGGEDRESGLLARFIFIRAEREKPGHWTDEGVARESTELLDYLTNKLAKWKPDAENGKVISAVLYPTDDAKQEYIAWYNAIENEKFRERDRAAMLGKLQAHALRFALILHVLNCVLDPKLTSDDLAMIPIPLKTMQKALRLADWVKAHQEQVWQMFEPGGPKGSIDPVQKAIVEVIVEHEAEITATGGKVENATLLEWVRMKPGMEGLNPKSLGRKAISLDLFPARTNEKRGYKIDRGDFMKFKEMLANLASDEGGNNVRPVSGGDCPF